MSDNNLFIDFYYKYYNAIKNIISQFTDNDKYKQLYSSKYANYASIDEIGDLIFSKYFIKKYRTKSFRLIADFAYLKDSYNEIMLMLNYSYNKDIIYQFNFILSFAKFYKEFELLPYFKNNTIENNIECNINNFKNIISIKLRYKNMEVRLQCKDENLFKLYIMDMNNRELEKEFNYDENEQPSLSQAESVLIDNITDCFRKNIKKQFMNILSKTICFYSPNLKNQIDVEDMIEHGLWLRTS